MTVYTQKFKVQSVEKALSKNANTTLKQIAENLGVGYSTLQRWIRLAKNNKLETPTPRMSKEQSPQEWNKVQRLEIIMACHSMTIEQVSSYCREQGIYPHHIDEWKAEFLLDKQDTTSISKQDKKKFKQEIKQLKK